MTRHKFSRPAPGTSPLVVTGPGRRAEKLATTIRNDELLRNVCMHGSRATLARSQTKTDENFRYGDAGDGSLRSQHLRAQCSASVSVFGRIMDRPSIQTTHGPPSYRS